MRERMAEEEKGREMVAREVEEEEKVESRVETRGE